MTTRQDKEREREERRGMKRVPKGLEVRYSPVHGYGVFALRPIKKDKRLIEYQGTRRRWLSLDGEDESLVYYFSVSPKTVIDPWKDGNAARYINHSCTPNCQAVQEGRRIYIESLRAIEPGEELFYDYHLELGHKPSKKDRQQYACLCGTPNCRGTMLALPKRKKL